MVCEDNGTHDPEAQIAEPRKASVGSDVVVDQVYLRVSLSIFLLIIFIFEQSRIFSLFLSGSRRPIVVSNCSVLQMGIVEIVLVSFRMVYFVQLI